MLVIRNREGRVSTGKASRGITRGAQRSIGCRACSTEAPLAVEEKVVAGTEGTDVLVGLTAKDAVIARVRPDRDCWGGGTAHRRHTGTVVPFKVLAS